MLGLMMMQSQMQEITGGITSSIFKKTEMFLLSSSDHQNALQHVVSRKDVGKYHSLMDFLFCELYPNPWKSLCFQFYDDSENTLPLRDALTPKEISVYDGKLLYALYVAHDVFCEKRRCSWSWYANEVEARLKRLAT